MSCRQCSVVECCFCFQCFEVLLPPFLKRGGDGGVIMLLSVCLFFLHFLQGGLKSCFFHNSRVNHRISHRKPRSHLSHWICFSGDDLFGLVVAGMK